MDHNDNLKFSFPFNFPPGPASQQSPGVNSPFNGFPQFQFDSPAEIGGEKSGQLSDPKPLECLHGNPIPPFLSKSYDLVEDPSLDPIISWGEKGNSFVVWEPADLATIVLPRYFKHGNFSSFVRQLNTYGFRKIDTNKWEFANEFFLQGSKHLLKNIKRRRSTQPQLVASEASRPEMEIKLEKLRTEKSVIMQDVADLQQQSRETAEHMETVEKSLQASERKQEKMVSFIAKAVQNPEFIERVMEMKEQRLLDGSSPRTRRKIVKQETEEQVESSEMPSSLPQSYVLQERMPFSSENESSDELGAPHDVGYFVDFPEELATDKMEEMLSMPNSMVDSWSTVGSYNFPVNGAFFSGGHLDSWESDMQGAGISEIDKWQYGEI